MKYDKFDLNNESSKYIYVRGIDKLTGYVDCDGSKNSALMCLAAASLVNSDDIMTLYNIPDVTDIRVMIEILRLLGKNVEFYNGKLTMSGKLSQCEIPIELTSAIRGSSYCLGIMISVLGVVENLGLPGGDKIGNRPIDIHLEALELMGVEYTLHGGKVNACIKKDKLHGSTIYLRFPSVGATCNIILAAVNAVGKTVILNAAKEPEIVDLANLLSKMGVLISGAGSDTITIYGCEKLEGNIEHEIVPDRIEAGTYIIIAAMLGENVIIRKSIPYHNYPLISILQNAGVDIKTNNSDICITKSKSLKPLNIMSMPFPGISTDLQPLLTVLSLLSNGTSTISDMVFPERFQYTYELIRMGANIYCSGNTVKVTGNSKLAGTLVEGSDIRGVTALICAGLIAVGTTEIGGISHLNRGYKHLIDKLESLGANITIGSKLLQE